MFPKNVPRVFTLAVALVFLVVGTSYYLYDDVPYYPSSSPKPASISIDIDAKRPDAGGLDGGSGGKTVEPGHLVPQASSLAAPTAAGTPPSEVPISASDSPSIGDDPRPLTPPSTSTGCDPDLAFLKQTNEEQRYTNNTVVYSRRCIKAVFSDKANRDEVPVIADPLTNLPMIIDLDKCADVKLPKCDPIKLTVPKPYPKDADFSHLLFGIATTYERLGSSLDSFSHWLAGTNAHLVALVTDFHSRNETMNRKMEKRYQGAGINTTFVEPLNEKFTVYQSHFTVIVHMVNHSTPSTQWFGLLDDDTFFPSLTPLSDALGKLDHKVDVYAGTLSEDFGAVRTFGFMAFGGAGAYLSAPLAKTLGSKAFQCIDEIDTHEGDTILRDCVYRNSKAKLTILPGLYQQDFKNDASGFFESGLRPINLHHWKSWFKEPVVKMATAADFCGDCFLQRWMFFPDMVLSNGYSVVKYRDGFENLDLQLMEGTFTNANRLFDWSIGPFREKLNPDEKKSYKLKDVHWDENGQLRQLYIWRGKETDGLLDEVIELIWQK